MPNTMENYANRLATFRAGHPATKKRASDPKGTRKLKWPHQTPSPEQLAHAGFYYNPTSSNPDNVTCYLCKSNLDGWEETDNAIDEHISHCLDCGWAVNVWVEQAIEKGISDLEDPLSERMLEARKMTFSTGWPHEEKRGWLCKTQKMSEAGWHYAPTPESDDFVKCSYCSLSLDGWEPKDKPLQEHQKRSPECLFFKLAGSKPKNAARTRKERVSKASRLSTQSNFTIASEAPSFADVELGGDDTLLSTAETKASETSKKTKGSKKSKAAAGSKKTAAKSPEEPMLASSYMEPEDDDFSVKVDVESQPKTRGKKRPSHQISKDSEDLQNAEEPREDAPPGKRRATRSRASVMHVHEPSDMAETTQDVQMEDLDSTILTAPVAPATKKGRKGGKRKGSSKARKTSNMSTASKASLRSILPDDDELDAALELDLDRPLTDEEQENEPPQAGGRRLTKTRANKATASVAPTRRTTRASTAPVETSIMVSNVPVHEEHAPTAETQIENIDEDTQQSRPKKAQLKKTKKAKQQSTEEPEEPAGQEDKVQDGDLVVDAAPPVVKKAPSKKGSRARQVSRQKPAPQVTEPLAAADIPMTEENSKLHQTFEDDSGHETDASVATQSRGTRKKPATKKGRKTKQSQVTHQNIEDIVQSQKTEVPAPTIDQDEAESQDHNDVEAVAPVKVPKSKQPAAKAKKGKKARKLSSPPPKVDSPVPSESKEVTPIPSPQSSDAENHPPSSRPSATRPPLSSVSTPNAPFIPPSTRIPLADVTPIKSPSKHTFSKLSTAVPWTAVDLELIFQASPMEEKENQIPAAGLSSPEKKMSVEQWVQYRAQQGEEKLRRDCERLVGKFESEGMRALTTLEGIVCVD